MTTTEQVLIDSTTEQAVVDTAAETLVVDPTIEQMVVDPTIERVLIDLTGADPIVTALENPMPVTLPDLRELSSPSVPGVAPQDRGDVPAVSLSVVMPVYNEEATVARAVGDVLSVEFPCPVELIVVNDGSTDRTPEILAGFTDPRLTVLHHEVNRGKGAALRTGAASAAGTHVVPFDADLEYSAGDLVPLLQPVLEGRATIVYGSRRSGHAVPHSSRLYAVGNTVMTRLANHLYGAALSDLHTCLKLVPRQVFTRIPLLEEGFGLDTELTAWLLRTGAAFAEVPISYHSRTRAEGKKIGWRDSLACLHILLLIRREHAPA